MELKKLLESFPGFKVRESTCFDCGESHVLESVEHVKDVLQKSPDQFQFTFSCGHSRRSWAYRKSALKINMR